MAVGTASVDTSRGTVRAWLRRPSWRGAGVLETSNTGDNGVSGSGTARLSRGSDADLRAEIRVRLIFELIGLVGG